MWYVYVSYFFKFNFNSVSLINVVGSLLEVMSYIIKEIISFPIVDKISRSIPKLDTWRSAINFLLELIWFVFFFFNLWLISVLHMINMLWIFFGTKTNNTNYLLPIYNFKARTIYSEHWLQNTKWDFHFISPL